MKTSNGQFSDEHMGLLDFLSGLAEVFEEYEDIIDLISTSVSDLSTQKTYNILTIKTVVNNLDFLKNKIKYTLIILKENSSFEHSINDSISKCIEDGILGNILNMIKELLETLSSSQNDPSTFNIERINTSYDKICENFERIKNVNNDIKEYIEDAIDNADSPL